MNSETEMKRMELQKLVVPHLLVDDEYMNMVVDRSIQCTTTLAKQFKSVSSSKHGSKNVSVTSNERRQHVTSHDKSKAQKNITIVKDIENRYKRSASSSTIDMPSKIPKKISAGTQNVDMSVKPKLSTEVLKINPVDYKNYQPKASCSITPLITKIASNPLSSSTNCLNSAIVPKQVTNQDQGYTKKTTESKHVKVEKNPFEMDKNYHISANGQFKFKQISDDTYKRPTNFRKIIKIAADNELFEITRPQMINDILTALGKIMEKDLTSNELDIIKRNSTVIPNMQNGVFKNEPAGGQVVSCHNTYNDIPMVPENHDEVNDDYMSTISDIEIFDDNTKNVDDDDVIVISSDDDSEVYPLATNSKNVSCSKVTVAYSLGANKYIGTVSRSYIGSTCNTKE